jgi:hypothetical protein
MDVNKIAEEVKSHFNGRDPIAEAQQRMKGMSNTELRKLVLLAANQIGMMLKGGDYESPLDASIFLSTGIDGILTAYDSASMNIQATTNETGFC